ncbi:MAG: hypothetical protein JWM53_6216, partial [bacterium]|nr:hypothetical protein [bacterium]
VTPLQIEGAPLHALTTALSSTLRGLAAAMRSGEPAPPLPPFDALLQPFEGSLLGARLGRLVQQLIVLQGAVARGKIASTAR